MKYRNLILALCLMLVLAAVGFLVLGDTEEAPEAAPTEIVAPVQITEICAKNETVILDNDGKFRDYIELYAPEQSVNLQGYVLTDGKVTSQPLGDITIGAGEYRVIFLSDETTGFAIGASGGDVIQLKTPGGNIAAQANVATMAADQVMIWVDGKYSVADQPSPGFPNTPQGEVAFLEGHVQENPKLTISELLVRNKSILPDEKGIYSDVVELYNCTTEELNLGNYYLSDSKENRFQYRMPNVTLAAGEYILVYCDSEYYVADGFIHANFGLSKGETLYLTDSTGGYVSVNGDTTGEDTSIQLSETGEYVIGAPSLGYPNTPEGVELALASRINADSALIISEVLLSSSGMPYQGTVTDVVEITNRSGSAVSTAGWYLSDGGDPYSYALPSRSLMPGETMVLKCDYNGTGFGLSQGEVLHLTGPDYRHAMPVTCIEGQLGMSISSISDQGEIAYGFMDVSLGYSNDQEGHKQYLSDHMPKGLRISEMVASNESYLRGPYGVACDWIEFYNGSDSAVNLADYALSDNPKNPVKYALPEVTLEPGRYYVILLTRDDSKAKKGYDVLPMELSSKGETLYLTNNGLVEDFVFMPELGVDDSYGRSGESMEFTHLAKPTPESANSQTAAVSADPVAVTAPGSYDDVEYLDVVLSAPGTIYYTTNCVAPDQNSRKYTGPIRITKTTVLRVISYEQGKSKSQIIDLTYLINENDNLSVVSLVTSPGNLWDPERGIYVDGPNITEEYPFLGANYHEPWERTGSVSLYEADGSGGFFQKCGVKIFGGYSRTNKKKSFACMFRKSYGDAHLEYPVFGDESLPYYDSLVLRASGQDVYGSRIRDEVITSVAAEYLGMPVQKFRPVAMYLNGEYWGIYFIREKINENYVAGNFGVRPEEVTLTHWSGSDCPEYMELKNYARTHDLSRKDYFDHFSSQINLENYTDFMVAQLWISNRDAGNVKYFTTTGGKWTWVLFDTDLAFYDAKENSFPYILNPNLNFDITTRTPAIRMLKNPQYQGYFIRRIAWQMNNVWTEENIIAYVDSISAQIQPDMKKECRRWNTSYAKWEESVESLRDFARNRNKYFLEDVQQYFKMSDQQMKDYGFPVE